MNKQDPGSGSSTPSVGEMKRKRGRPCKEKSAVPEENVNVMPTSDQLMNINEATGKTDDCDDVKVGDAFTGVVEGSFSTGYLLNVKIEGSETFLRGIAFPSGHFSPADILNQQAQIYSSVPSLGRRSEQPAEPESQMPSSDNHVFPTELHSPIAFSPDKKDETMHELNVSRKLRDVNEGGATKDSEPTLEYIKSAPINLYCDEEINLYCDEEPSVCFRNDDLNETEAGATKRAVTIYLPKFVQDHYEELPIPQQTLPSFHKMYESAHAPSAVGGGLRQDSWKNADLNQALASAEPESVPTKEICKSLFKVQYRRRRLTSHTSGSASALKEEVATSGANTEMNVVQPNESSVNSAKPDDRIGSDNV